MPAPPAAGTLVGPPSTPAAPKLNISAPSPPPPPFAVTSPWIATDGARSRIMPPEPPATPPYPPIAPPCRPPLPFASTRPVAVTTNEAAATTRTAPPPDELANALTPGQPPRNTEGNATESPASPEVPELTVPDPPSPPLPRKLPPAPPPEPFPAARFAAQVGSFAAAPAAMLKGDDTSSVPSIVMLPVAASTSGRVPDAFTVEVTVRSLA